MVHSETRMATPQARRFLGQLCKHFAHKIPVEFTPDSGLIAFPAGTCRLAAEPDGLRLRAEAEDLDHLAQVERVVGGHLVRFAFREQPELVWNRDG